MLKTYVGIIDDFGLESFTDGEKNRFPYTMRARLNPHRNARVYAVVMDEETAKEFDKKIKKEQKWKEHAKELLAKKSFRWIY